MKLLSKTFYDPILRRAFVAALAAAFFTAILSLALPNFFRSETLVLPKVGGGAGAAAMLAATAGIPSVLGLGRTDEESYYSEIVGSHWMAEKLLNTEFDFKYQSWYFGKPQQRRQTLQQFFEVNSVKEYDRALETLNRWVEPRRDAKTGVMKISAEAPSPELAQQLAQKTTEYLDLALKTRVRTQAGARADYARQRLQVIRAEEERIRKVFEDFAKSHINFNQSPDPGVRTKGERLVIDLTLIRQVVGNLTIAYEQAELEARNTVPVISVLDDAYLPRRKHRPGRSGLVFLSALLVGGLVWGWGNRLKITHQLFFESSTKSNE